MNRLIKISFFSATLILMLLSFSSVQAQVQKAHPNTYISTYSNGFYDYLPQGYSATGTTLYPVIIFVHGSWEAGSGSTTDLPKVLKHGPPHVINSGQFPTSFSLNGKTYKVIVFSPQMKSSSAGAAAMNTVIDYVLKHYKADPNRIYLTGLSSGGGTVESTVSDATVGKRVAAVVEFAGSGSPSVTKATNIVNNKIPFWGIHNRYDSDVPYTKTVGWVSDILSVKSTFLTKKTIPDATGHNCWSSRYVPTWTEGGLSVYQWMLQYSKGTTTTTNNSVPTANAGGDKTIWLPTSSVTLSGSGKDADGSISKYSWTKVSGPASSVFSSTTNASTTVSSLAAGTYVFRLKVTDNGGATDYDDVNVVVKSPLAIPSKVEAENYSSMSGIMTETTTDVNGGKDVGSIDLGDWLNYSLKASSSGTYTLTFRVATQNTGAQFQVKNSGGSVLATVNVPNTGGYQTWKSVTAKVTLPSGTQTLKVYSSASAHWNLNYISFSTGNTTTSTPSVTKVEAENYNSMAGVVKETTTDAGGGQDVGSIDQNDWFAYYNVNAPTASAYTFTFRLASAATGGKFGVYDTYNSVKTLVATVSVPNTGGWQVWKNVTASINFKAGTHVITIVSAATAHWNINYFTYGTSTTLSSTSLEAGANNTAIAEKGTSTASALSVSPNSFSNQFLLSVNNKNTGTMKVQLIDLSGVVRKEFLVIKNAAGTLQTYLSAGTLTKGTYVVKAQLGDWTQSIQVIKL